jgi:hypothetical protein
MVIIASLCHITQQLLPQALTTTNPRDVTAWTPGALKTITTSKLSLESSQDPASPARM